ncbi:hypothetical protein AMATHDRAFT_55142 [Amanita thiersii Skay4041]|uniref:PEBP-like protein n=1 Tax=Amanita thiersii Skay4041 TaxID=703135 RepID=A0A2A9NZ28_9AGAR|nr:hypothetical protein AMATHDRAFT_55142 [Amanita thiersii Skay4041]
MKWALLTSFLCLLSPVLAQDTSLDEVKRAFEVANIPRDLSINFDPQVLLEVVFPEPSGAITLHAGEQLPRNATAGPPSFGAVGTDFTGPFVIAAIDPDAPTPQEPTNAQIRHFLGGNFFGRSTRIEAEFLRNSTPAISEFRQPTPPAGSDAHRYIFLLFKQPATFNDQTEITTQSPISLFNISQFAKDVGLGDPIGGTFMLVAPDA